MKNIWLFEFNSERQVAIVRSLLRDHPVEVSLSVSSESGISGIEKISAGAKTELLLNTSVTSLLHLDQIDNFSDIEKILEKIDTKYLLLALQNLDRNETRNGSLNFSERLNLILNQLVYWESKIEESGSECFVFCKVPHKYYEFIIVGLGEAKNIPAIFISDLMGEANVINDSLFRSVETNDDESILRAIPKKIELVRHREVRNLDKERMSFPWIKFMKSLIASTMGLLVGGSAHYKKGYFLEGSKGKWRLPSKRRQSFYEIVFLLRMVHAKSRYRKLATGFDLVKTNYVYFPLVSHFENIIQPVASPLDLHTAIRKAIAKIREDQTLVIREHPVQFTMRHHLRFSRESDFYRDLVDEPKVRLAPLDLDHFELIENCDYVFCFGSTSALLESLLLGKKVYFVGNLPYSSGDEFSGWLDKSDLKNFKNIGIGGIDIGASGSESRVASRIFSSIIRMTS